MKVMASEVSFSAAFISVCVVSRAPGALAFAVPLCGRTTPFSTWRHHQAIRVTEQSGVEAKDFPISVVLDAAS